MGSTKGKLIVMVAAVALASFWQGEEQVTYPGHFEQKCPSGLTKSQLLRFNKSKHLKGGQNE